MKSVLATWLSLLEHHSVHWKVAGSISRQGTCLGFGFHPQLGSVLEATIHVSFSHCCFSLSPFLSLKSMETCPNMSSGEDYKKKKTKNKKLQPWLVWLSWGLSHKTKGRRFNSQSGHMPGLWVQSPIRAHTIDVFLLCQRFSPTLMFLYLSLPTPL